MAPGEREETACAGSGMLGPDAGGRGGIPQQRLAAQRAGCAEQLIPGQVPKAAAAQAMAAWQLQPSVPVHMVQRFSVDMCLKWSPETHSPLQVCTTMLHATSPGQSACRETPQHPSENAIRDTGRQGVNSKDSRSLQMQEGLFCSLEDVHGSVRHESLCTFNTSQLPCPMESISKSLDAEAPCSKEKFAP